MTKTKSVRFLVATLILLIAGNISFAQNTKGDKPSKPLPRITLKSKPGKTKKVASTTRDISGRRLRTKNKSTAARAVVAASSPYEGRRSRGGDRPARPIGGKPKRILSSSAQAARNNIYPNKGPYINNPSPRPHKSERSFANPGPIGRPLMYSTRSNASPYPKKRRISPRSGSRSFVTRGRKNVYWGKFSKGEKPFTKDITGRPLRTKNFSTPPIGLISQRDPYKGKKRTGDKLGRSSKSIFSISSQRNGKAWTGDISGRPIRRNGGTKKVEIAGERSFSGFLSVKRKQGPGKPIRGSGYQTVSGKRRKNIPLAVRIPKGGAGVASYRGTYKRSQLRPDFGDQGSGFSGNIKGRRPEKGGGSISGLNYNRKPIPAKIPKGGAQAGSFSGNLKRNKNNFTDQGAGFSGFVKRQRPIKGGGSISGRSRNNKGNPLAVRLPKSNSARIGTYSGNLKTARTTYRDQGEGFAGFSKAQRPVKGGGSITGRPRSNNGNPIAVRLPKSNSARIGTYSGNLKTARTTYRDQGEGFAGFTKAQRPVKGGGSITGRPRSNNGNPIAVKLPPGSSARAGTYTGNLKKSQSGTFRDQGEEFAGYIRARRPAKGGGSVSGKLWNNKGEPIPGRAEKDYTSSGFAGKIKLKRFNSYTQNPNANENSTKKKSPSNNTFAVNGLQIRVKQDNYKQNPLASQFSLKKREPQKGAFATNGLQIKIKQQKYQKNPNAKEGALKAIGPKANSVRASEFEGKMKMLWSYSHNPSSSKDALKTINPNKAFNRGNEFQGRARLTKNYRHNPKSDKEALKVIAPGRAYAKINNYQGNLKMSKPHGSKLHPDAKFAHGHIDNVKKERTILTNVKLLWSKFFKKNDVQPTAVKEKVRRPRYDKKEKDLWKDLYD